MNPSSARSTRWRDALLLEIEQPDDTRKSDHRRGEVQTAEYEGDLSFDACEGLVLDALRGFPLGAKHSRWDLPLELVDNRELRLIQLLVRDDDRPPGVAECDTGGSENRYGEGGFLVRNPFANQEPERREQERVDGEEEPVFLLPARDQALLGFYEQSVLLEEVVIESLAITSSIPRDDVPRDSSTGRLPTQEAQVATCRLSNPPTAAAERRSLLQASAAAGAAAGLPRPAGGGPP